MLPAEDAPDAVSQAAPAWLPRNGSLFLFFERKIPIHVVGLVDMLRELVKDPVGMAKHGMYVLRHIYQHCSVLLQTAP